MAEDYCELCDLPLSQCVHGMPKAPPTPAPAPVTTRVVTSRAPRTPSPAREPRTSGAATSSGAAAAPARRAPSLVTDQGAFRDHIVRILRVEGPLETEDMLLELEMAMEDVLRDRDRTKAPTGETRWHTTARAERKAMIDTGLLVEGKPGVWELTDAGRTAGTS